MGASNSVCQKPTANMWVVFLLRPSPTFGFRYLAERVHGEAQGAHTCAS